MGINSRKRWVRSQFLLASIAGFGVFIGLPVLAQTSPTTTQPTAPDSTQTSPTTTQPAAPDSIQTSPTTTQPTTPGSSQPSPTAPITQPASPGSIQTSPTTTQPASPGSSSQPSTQTPSPSSQSLVQLLQQASSQGSFKTLAQLVQAAGITNQLQSGGGSYTIFAPTDAAFAALPQGILEKLQRPENQALLRRVLAYHVVPQELPSSGLKTGSVKTLGGGVAVRVNGNKVVVNNASVVQADIQAGDGVVHAVNRVLLPAELRQQLTSLR